MKLDNHSDTQTRPISWVAFQNSRESLPVSAEAVSMRNGIVVENNGYIPVPVGKTFSLLLGKRFLDIIGAIFALIVFSPLLLLVALLVKSTSKGPVIFRQKRLGRGGKEFQCYKFRTMVVDAEAVLQHSPTLLAEFRESYKIKHDPRITYVGHFLRRTSLDELPQFVNVLRGDMSLIGPRPIVPKELEKYHIYGEKLLSVKPGLSGMWQANGRSDTTYAERIAMDMDYIDRYSLWLDLKLILLTVRSIFRRHGAY